MLRCAVYYQVMVEGPSDGIRTVCNSDVAAGLCGGGVLSSASCGLVVLVSSSGQMSSVSGELVPDEGFVLAWV